MRKVNDTLTEEAAIYANGKTGEMVVLVSDDGKFAYIGEDYFRHLSESIAAEIDAIGNLETADAKLHITIKITTNDTDKTTVDEIR